MSHDDKQTLSTSKAVKLLLGSFLSAQAALRRGDGVSVRVAPGSRVLWQDGYYEDFYRWLEYALDDMRLFTKPTFVATWMVYVEQGRRRHSPRMIHRADSGVRFLEDSPYRPTYVRVPEDLSGQPRKRSHDAKREQNKEIRALASEGRTHQEIADIYGITRGRITQILAA